MQKRTIMLELELTKAKTTIEKEQSKYTRLKKQICCASHGEQAFASCACMDDASEIKTAERETIRRV
jgi:hypothetical protein